MLDDADDVLDDVDDEDDEDILQSCHAGAGTMGAANLGSRSKLFCQFE